MYCKPKEYGTLHYSLSYSLSKKLLVTHTIQLMLQSVINSSELNI